MRHDRIPLKSADEYDALTRWRRFLRFRPGQRKKVKRQYNKRLRRAPWQKLTFATTQRTPLLSQKWGEPLGERLDELPVSP